MRSPLATVIGLVTHRAFSQTGNRGRCVTRPHKGCEMDNSKCSTDAASCLGKDGNRAHYIS